MRFMVASLLIFFATNARAAGFDYRDGERGTGEWTATVRQIFDEKSLLVDLVLKPSETKFVATGQTRVMQSGQVVQLQRKEIIPAELKTVALANYPTKGLVDGAEIKVSGAFKVGTRKVETLTVFELAFPTEEEQAKELAEREGKQKQLAAEAEANLVKFKEAKAAEDAKKLAAQVAAALTYVLKDGRKIKALSVVQMDGGATMIKDENGKKYLLQKNEISDIQK